jgi:hypothetical protein
MKHIEEGLSKMSQSYLLARKIEDSMDCMANGTELT